MELQTLVFRHRGGKILALELGKICSQKEELTKARQTERQEMRGQGLEVYWGALLD